MAKLIAPYKDGREYFIRTLAQGETYHGSWSQTSLFFVKVLALFVLHFIQDE